MRYQCLLLLLFLAGCGGGSGLASNNAPLNPLPFSTSRVGTWTGPMHGPLTLGIASDRKITGSWQADTGTTWAITGQTSDPIIHDNSVSLNFVSETTTIFGTGTLLVTRADHLTGSLTITGVGVQATYAVDVTRQ